MLIIIDLFSKFVEIVAMRDQTAESVCSALLNGWIYRNRVPDMLLRDQGRNVDGEAVRKMCAGFGINKKHSSAYHPQGDGQAERAVESVKQALRCFLVDHNLVKTSWPSVLQEVAFIVNSLMSSSTKFTPQELMFGASIRSANDQVVGDCHKTGDKERRSREQGECVNEAAENIANAKSQAKRHYDRNTVEKPTCVLVGQSILLRNFTREDGLAPKYIGPYLVCDTKYPNLKIKRETSTRGFTSTIVR